MDVVLEICLDYAQVQGREREHEEDDAGDGSDGEQDQPLLHLVGDDVEPEPDGDDAE